MYRSSNSRPATGGQPHDWAEGEAEQIEHLLIRRSGPWPGVVFKAGGLEYEFDCVELRLIVEMPGDVIGVRVIDR